MALHHVETTISETAIRMRLANNGDPLAATEWFEFSLPLTAPLTLPNNSGGAEIPIGPLHTRQLASIQLAALRYVRDAIGEETQRLASLART
jgi:hypothetical protein